MSNTKQPKYTLVESLTQDEVKSRGRKSQATELTGESLMEAVREMIGVEEGIESSVEERKRRISISNKLKKLEYLSSSLCHIGTDLKNYKTYDHARRQAFKTLENIFLYVNSLNLAYDSTQESPLTYKERNQADQLYALIDQLRKHLDSIKIVLGYPNPSLKHVCAGAAAKLDKFIEKVKAVVL